MKYYYTIFLFLILPMVSFGQGNYLLTDTSKVERIRLIKGDGATNARICQVKEFGRKITTYTPYDIKEYGFNDGRVYISREIQIGDSLKRVFLQRLHKGEPSLYYYEEEGLKTFFIERDSTLLIEIPKQNLAGEDFSKQLSNLTKDCPNVSDACKLVCYKKKSLAKLISRYDNCVLKPFPHFKYGLILGYEYAKLNPLNMPNTDLSYFDYTYDGGFSFGLFLDNPINVSDFSIHAELLLSKHGYSYHTLVDNKDLDFVANFTSLNIPILLRYAYPSNKIRPFINAGAYGTYFIKNKTHLFKTSISGNTIEINDTKTSSIISDFQIGYAVGGGLEIKLNYKNSLFFELRYCNQYNIGNYQFTGNSAFSLLTSINF